MKFAFEKNFCRNNKRPGASLLGVMVFMLFAVMISAQIFFFSVMSANSLHEETRAREIRISLEKIIREAKNNLLFENKNLSADYKTFHENTLIKKFSTQNFHVQVNDLKYVFLSRDIKVYGTSTSFYQNEWDEIPFNEKVFPPVSDDKGHYFLIRAYTKQDNITIMLQVLARKNFDDNKIKIISENEIWFGPRN